MSKCNFELCDLTVPTLHRIPIRAKWVASTHVLPPTLRRAINAAWSKAKQKKGVSLFDGPLCRVESWRNDEGRLLLSLSRTSYKWFWGTNLKGLKLPEAQMANALGLSAVVLSADGFLLMGKRNNRVAYHPNRVHPFAGSAVDADVYAEIRRELTEELGFTNTDIADVRYIGMARDRAIGQMETIFRVISRRTRAEIEGRLDPAEHGAIWSMRAQRARVFRVVERSGPLTPIARAALLLWYFSCPPTAADARRAIAKAERLLPGTPVEGPDPRWQALLKIEDFIPWHPELVWKFVLRWGKHRQKDLRVGIGVVLLERLLDRHFNLIFPRVREAVRENRRFQFILSKANWIGEAAWPSSAQALDKLAGVKRPRIHPRRPKKLSRISAR